MSNDEREAYLDEYCEFLDENMYTKVDENYLQEKESEAQTNGTSYLTKQQFDGLQKKFIQTEGYISTVRRSGLAGLSSLRDLKGSTNQIASHSRKKNKNESNAVSPISRNKNLDSNGEFADPIVESQYRTYVNRKEKNRKRGREVETRGRLAWKEASDY